MIKLKDNIIQAELLNDDGTLNERIIKGYDYIKIKNNFERVIDLMAMNQLSHEIYKEQLKYEINDNLEFVVFYDNESNVNKNISKKGMTGIVTYSSQYYENSTRACIELLAKVKYAWNHLNEVERFIIKCLEFDKPPQTDEELIDKLITYKNKYFIYKKSGFIKLSICLKLNKDTLDSEEHRKSMYEYLKWYSELEDTKMSKE